MLNFFLDKYIHYAVLTFLLAWMCCLVLFFDFWPEWFVWIYGFVGVLMFFYGSAYCIRHWCRCSSRLFCKRVFWTAFVIRVCYVFISYFFYKELTGRPFEFIAMDSFRYYSIAERFYAQSLFDIPELIKNIGWGISDSGYVTYLMVINKIFGGAQIIIPRLLHALWGAFICIFTYRIGRRHFGELVARIASIMCLFLPNLIFYCGLHLKEATMLFVLMLFLERADKVLSQNRISIIQWGFVGLLILVMFTFRTVLGVCAIMALFVTLVMSRQAKGKMMSWAKRLVVIFMALFFIGFSMSDSIINEIEETSEIGTIENQRSNYDYIASKNKFAFAELVGATVFVPMIFAIPFPAIVYTEGQENMRMISTGNYIKNVLSLFVILTMFAMLMSGEWRSHILLISFYLGYLCVLVFSNFAHSERFHFLILPLMLLFASKGIVELKHKTISLWWLVLMFVALIAWNWFKLAGRGII